MKKLVIAAITAVFAVTFALFAAGCYSDDSTGESTPASEVVTTKLAFKEELPEFFTAGVPVNVSKLVDYEAGSLLTVSAEYEANGETGVYLVTGVTFTPDKIGKVTVSVELGENKISKEFEVKVAPPVIVAVAEAELTKGEKTDLASLVSYVDYTANADYPVTFKAISYIPVGGDEDEDTVLFESDEYVFEEAGSYVLTFTLSNEGGEVKDEMFVSVKRALGANEINDISNYKRGFYTPVYANGTISYDEVDHAANSDWSFMLKADATATAEAGGKESEGYWNQFGLIALEKNIDLSKSYIELDVKLSPDARNYVGIGFMDEGESTVKYHWVSLEKQDEWVHLSMQYKLTEGSYKFIRIAVVHPFKSDRTDYNEGNVWVKIDNVKVSDYDYPIVENGIIFDREGSTAKRLRFMVSHNKTLNYVNQLAWGNNTTFTVLAEIDGANVTLNGYVEEAAPQVFWIESINANKGTKLAFKQGEKFAIAGNDDVEFTFTNDVTVYSDGEKWQTNDPYEGYVRLAPEYGETPAFTVIGKTIEASSASISEIYLNGEKTNAVLAVANGKITIEGNYADGDKIEIREDAVLTVGGEEMPVLGSVTFIRKGSAWVGKVIEVEPIVSSVGGYIAVWDIAHEENLNYLSSGAQELSVNGQLDDIDTIFRGFVEKANPQRLYFNSINVWQAFAPVKGTKIQIAAGSEIKFNENPQTAFVVKNEITIYFDGTNWTTEVVEKDPVAITISGLVIGEWCKTFGNSARLAVNSTSLTIPVAPIANWRELGLEMYYNDVLMMSGSCYAGAADYFVLDGITAVKGDKVEIKSGANFTLEGQEYVFGEGITVYFDGEHWTTEVVTVEKNYTLSGITLGSNTSASCFVFTFAEGEIPAGMLSAANIGRGGNASGTLLTDGKCGDYSLYDLWTGIIASGSSVTFYVATPEGNPVEDGTRFYIPSGSVLMLGEESFTLGEEISYVWLNGAWVKGTPKYMTGFVIGEWCASTGNATTFYIDNTTATLPNKVTNLLYNGLVVYLNGTALDRNVVSCYADNPRLFIVTDISVVKGDKLEVKKGAGFILDNEIYVFGEGITVYFDGAHWTTEVVVAD